MVAATNRSDAYDDPRVAEALRQYMAEREAGRPINRRDLLDKFPDVADAIVECIEGLDFLQTAAAELHREAAPTPARAATVEEGQWFARPLGDFKIVEQIGSGGMGVVYEAIQLSLGRRVAVKVLPFAAALDPTQLQRFKNEAQAAAQLHHSNIVPVYAVGCDRGIHFYAMQLIEGKSLASVIGELRQAERAPTTPNADTGSWSRFEVQCAPGDQSTTGRPVKTMDHAKSTPEGSDVLSQERASNKASFFRTAARLVCQAAEALEYAHQMGIVHRDVKPANLMVDYRGNLWITDFGLAHIQAGAALTATNRVVGTLPYMSPEQLGKGVLLDHRTDVYSLGVTLYELLTLRPAFADADLQHLQRLIQNEEPVSPRSLEPLIPYDLETIVLKAMSKSVADRYGSARELADDLQRYLLDQPIRAKRPTLREHISRWMRRHRRVVQAGVAVLALMTIVFAVSTALVVRANARTEVAFLQLQLKAEEAEKEKRHAEENFQKARRAVDAFAQLTTTPSQGPPNFTEMRRKLLEIALDYYQELLDDSVGDPARQAELAPTRELVAQLLRETQEHEGGSQGMRFIMILEDSQVRRDLALSAEQVRRIDETIHAFHSAPRDFFSPTSEQSPAQRRETFLRRSEKTKGDLLGVLSVVQVERLKQLQLQLRGPRSLIDPDVASALHLSDQQVADIRGIFDDQAQRQWNDMIRQGKSPQKGPPSPPVSPLVDPKVRAALTADQQAAFEKLIGRPFLGVFGPPPRPISR